MTPEGHESWGAAGLYPSDGGVLGHAPLGVGEVYVPNLVELADGQIRWRFGPDLLARTSTGMLDAATRLGTHQDVLRYVRRFGPIQFCEKHRLPVGHNPMPDNPFDDPMLWQLSGGWPLELPDRETFEQSCRVKKTPGTHILVESADSYLRLARQLRGALDVASALRHSDPAAPRWADIGTEEQWRDFTLDRRGRPFAFGEHPEEMAEDGESLISTARALDVDVYVARYIFTTELRLLTSFARLRPSVEWLKDRAPQFVIAADGFGTLLLQLMNAVTATYGLVICSGCGEPYAREGRKPQEGRRNYCPTCKESGIPQRDAKRAQRAGNTRKRSNSG